MAERAKWRSRAMLEFPERYLTLEKLWGGDVSEMDTYWAIRRNNLSGVRTVDSLLRLPPCVWAGPGEMPLPAGGTPAVLFPGAPIAPCVGKGAGGRGRGGRNRRVVKAAAGSDGGPGPDGGPAPEPGEITADADGAAGEMAVDGALTPPSAVVTAAGKRQAVETTSGMGDALAELERQADDAVAAWDFGAVATEQRHKSRSRADRWANDEYDEDADLGLDGLE